MKKKTTASEDFTKDGHYLEASEYGSGSGYAKTGDTYTVAPVNAQVFENMLNEQRALDDYVKVVNQFIVERYKEIAERKSSWWEARQLGMRLEPGKKWTYDPARKLVFIPAENLTSSENPPTRREILDKLAQAEQRDGLYGHGEQQS